MKVNIQKYISKLRVLAFKSVPVAVAFAIVVTCMSFGVLTANAVVYNYEDYVVRVSVDGENDLCVVQLPEEFYRLSVTYRGSDDIVPGGVATDFVNGTDVLSFVWTPNLTSVDFTLDFGGSSNYLNTMNIPNGSILEFRVTNSFNYEDFNGDPVTATAANVKTELQYYDSAYNQLASNIKQFTTNLTMNGATRFRIPFSKPADAYCCVPSVSWNKIRLSDAGALSEWQIDSCQLVFTISSAYREAGISGEYGELILAVTEQLAKNQENADAFYEYMEEDMGVTHEQLDDIMGELATSGKSLSNIETQNANIIKGQDTIIDQQDQLLGGQQNMIEQNEVIIEQNGTMIQGSEESQETVSWLDQYLADVENMMEDLAADMEVDKPSVNAGDYRPNQFVDQVVFNNYTNVLSMTWRNPNIETMVLVVSALILVSFVFFGKKK